MHHEHEADCVTLVLEDVEFREVEACFNCDRSGLRLGRHKDVWPADLVRMAEDLHLKVHQVFHIRNEIADRLSPEALKEKLAARPELLNLLREKHEHPLVVIIEDRELLMWFEVMLLQMKAALDTYAGMVGKGCRIKSHLSFGKSKVGTTPDVPGGSLLNALDRPPFETRGKATEIAGIVREHKRTWIDEGIRLRDRCAHHGGVARNLRLKTDPLICPIDRVDFPLKIEGRPAGELINAIATGLLSLCNESLARFKSA